MALLPLAAVLFLDLLKMLLSELWQYSCQHVISEKNNFYLYEGQYEEMPSFIS
jgi:hypothetical protein